MKIYRNFWMVCLLIGLSACKKQDPIMPKVPYELIVEGGINTYSERQFIKLSKPASFAAVEDTKPINGAKVTVNDGQNDVPFAEIGNTGVYSARVLNNKNYNGTYTLKVEYNQKTYTAADKLIPVFPIDANYLPLSVKTIATGYRVTIPKHTFGTLNAQQWLILPAGRAWTPDKMNESYPYSYSYFYGTPNALHPLIQQARIIDLVSNDSLNIYKYSLSNEYSEYLYSLFQETDWKGLFSSVPSNVQGNISGNANGFFYATDVEMQKKAVKDLIDK